MADVTQQTVHTVEAEAEAEAEAEIETETTLRRVSTPAPTRTISWRDARALAAASGAPGGTESVELAEAIGRVLATDLVAKHDIPHFASSAMDGWAVSGPGPWRIAAPTRSGSVLPSLQTGHTVPIVTGGAIPVGTSSVLRSEHARVDSGWLTSSAEALSNGTLPDGQHIRRAGEETRKGETIMRRGTVLNPAHVAVAALAAHDSLDVMTRPSVRFVLTGDEVDQHGTPGVGRVRDTFGPQLPGLLTMLGARVFGTQRAQDTRQSTLEALEASIRGCTIVISTGGTGHSSADQLRDALSALGATILFDGIAMRPGGPTILARAANGCFIVCLPGNPLAAMVGLFTVVVPLVAACAGRPVPPLSQTVVGTNIAGRTGTTLVIPYRLVSGQAWPSEFIGSAMMRGLADADGLLVVDGEGVAAGSMADVMTLPWHSA